MTMMTRTILDGSPDLDLTGDFFFDTNILVYLHGPYVDWTDWRTRIYSKLMSGILSQHGRILIDTIVVTEFINLYIRILHRDLADRGIVSSSYKDFRRTVAFEAIADAAGTDLTGFCRSAEVLETKIDRDQIEQHCGTLKEGSLDFNDLVIADACRRHSLVLVTHDGDFHEVDVPVITANRRFVH